MLLWTLLDVLRTLVMPRAARGRFRLSRILFRPVWQPWRWIGVRRKTIQSRERVLAAAAPSFFFILLLGWVSLALLAYALILWSPAFVHGLGGSDGWRTSWRVTCPIRSSRCSVRPTTTPHGSPRSAPCSTRPR